MRAVTGETTCQTCGQRVLVCRFGEDSTVVLDTRRTEGPWQPRSDNRGILTADYTPKSSGRPRDGHEAHRLKCESRLLPTLERSRERIAQRTTEQDGVPRSAATYRMLPVLTPEGAALMARGHTLALA